MYHKGICLFLLLQLFTGTTKAIEGNNNFRIDPRKALFFIENKGQVSDQNNLQRADVLFSGTNGQMVYHLRTNGVSYQLSKTFKTSNASNSILSDQKEFDEHRTTIYRVDVNWKGVNSKVKVSGSNAALETNNYYLSNCKEGIRDVRNFNEVLYKSIYPGIDAKWYQKDGGLKYDYLVEAGADHKQIQLQIEGAEKIAVNKMGELVIQTPLGNITEQAPLVLQNNKILKSKWIVKGNVVSINIDNVDPKLPFVIDPVIRVWATYYGGTGGETGICAVDKSGNIYMTGQTTTTVSAIMATAGAHQINIASPLDAYLVKFNAAGVRQWSTYYGGSLGESAYACAIDASGDVYISGRTDSNTGISTIGSHQSTFGGNADAFLAKFSPAGVRLWATYYGGTGWEYGYSCATDLSGNVYLIGDASTTTGTSIATIGSHQSVFGGAFYDGYIVKFNSAGVRQWGTYYGGDLTDYLRSCATDKFGNVYIAGTTDSYTGTTISTPGAHQSTSGGFTDGFLVKFNSTGVRQWGTYYGGPTYDQGVSCCTDTLGNVFLAGKTDAYAGTIIATPGTHQSVHAGGGDDAYVVKFNSNGIRQWGTYYGTPGADHGIQCTADKKCNVYLCGYTDSNFQDVLASANSHQMTNGGPIGSSDGYLAKFDVNGTRSWGTYYGGGGNEYAFSLAVDTSCQFIYLAGYANTNTGTVIATLGSHQSVIGGGSDAFLVKFFDCNAGNTPTVSVSSSSSVLCAGNPATLTANGAANYVWNTSATSSLIVVTPTLNTTYTVTGYAVNNCPHSKVYTQTVSICTKINELNIEQNSMFIFPNPAQSYLNTALKVSARTKIELAIYNSLGQIVYSIQETIPLGESVMSINVSELQEGLYYISAKGETVEVTKRFVVIR